MYSLAVVLTKKADAASKFALWATSKDYEKLVGDKLGYARVPSGKRASTYALPEYQKVSGSSLPWPPASRPAALRTATRLPAPLGC